MQSRHSLDSYTVHIFFSPAPALFKHCLLDIQYIKLTFYYGIQWDTTNMGLLTFPSLCYLGNVPISFPSVVIIVVCCPNACSSFPQLWHVHISSPSWKSWRFSLCLNIYLYCLLNESSHHLTFQTPGVRPLHSQVLSHSIFLF